MFNFNRIYTFSGVFEENNIQHYGWKRNLFKDEAPWSAASGDYLFSKCFKKDNRAYWSDFGDFGDAP